MRMEQERGPSITRILLLLLFCMDVPTMNCRVLERKLDFLRVMAGDTDSLRGSILLALVLCDM